MRPLSSNIICAGEGWNVLDRLRILQLGGSGVWGSWEPERGGAVGVCVVNECVMVLEMSGLWVGVIVNLVVHTSVKRWLLRFPVPSECCPCWCEMCLPVFHKVWVCVW